MRLPLLLLALAAPASAEIASFSDCSARIAEDPAAAREEAALWARTGGGSLARICEAFALEAAGARDAAATLLTELAQDQNAGLDADARAELFVNAGDLWRDLGQFKLARETYRNARKLGADPAGLLSLAMVEMELLDWAGALETLNGTIAANPSSGIAALMKAEVLRELGQYEAALAVLDGLTDGPAGLLERARILAAMGQREAALDTLARQREADTARLYTREAQVLLQQILLPAPPPVVDTTEKAGPVLRPRLRSQ